MGPPPHVPSQLTPPSSPVHQAAPPVEAATVDEIDALFEVLFAGEASNRVEGHLWGLGSEEVSPPHGWDSKGQTALGVLRSAGTCSDQDPILQKEGGGSQTIPVKSHHLSSQFSRAKQ